MLSAAENAYITRTGPGTPMGDFFRRFWLPALTSEELPEPDCTPIRLKLLGENLIAFRDSDGRVGVLEEKCPHRRASLFFGRNEECGLRCVYHGWKFDVEGNCVDTPTEPDESNFKDKVKAGAYPAREHGGTIWVYMGPAEKMGGLPQLEWANVSEMHRYYVGRYEVEANWLQVMEGSNDLAHLEFLHKWVIDTPEGPAWNRDLASAHVPNFEEHWEAPFGAVLASHRAKEAADEFRIWRVTPLLFPTWILIASPPERTNRSAVAFVPVDDQTAVMWKVVWSTTEPFTAAEKAAARDLSDWSGTRDGSGQRRGVGIAFPTLLEGTVKPVANARNNYLIDRDIQRAKTFTGVSGVSEQDLMAQESMGPVCDRDQEHLGASDIGVIVTRQALIKAARDLEEGKEPFAATHGEVYNVRSAQFVTKIGDPCQTNPGLEALMETGLQPVS